VDRVHTSIHKYQNAPTHYVWYPPHGTLCNYTGACSRRSQSQPLSLSPEPKPKKPERPKWSSGCGFVPIFQYICPIHALPYPTLALPHMIRSSMRVSIHVFGIYWGRGRERAREVLFCPFSLAFSYFPFSSCAVLPLTFKPRRKSLSWIEFLPRYVCIW
jgi:hypothetical protein